jgi:hypothetical protein
MSITLIGGGLQVPSNMVQRTTIEKSANFTAALHGQYISTATLTVTDPTPSQGHEFVVHVRNGTSTVGGVAYAAGQTIWRSYHSGAWSNNLLTSSGSTLLTSGRVPFVTTGGLLTDNTVFEYANGVVTVGDAGVGGDVGYHSVAAGVAKLAGVSVSGGATLNYALWVDTTDSTVLRLGTSSGATRTTILANLPITVSGSSTSFVEYLVQNTGTGTTSRSRYRALNADSTATVVYGIYNATETTVRYGLTLGNWANLECASGGVNGLIIGCSAVDKPIVFGINASEVARLTSTGASFLQPITVPNGTAAAPGLRLTSEASGLYRVSSTSLGFAVAGSGVASLTSGQVFTVGLGSGAVTASIVINGTAGQTRQFAWQSAGVDRWHLRADSTAESGSDAGSLFVLSARTDAGALIDNPLSIVRASGGAITLARPVACSNATASTSTTTGALTVAGGVGVAGQATVRRIAYAVGTIATTGAIAALASDDGFTRLTGAAPDIQGIANPGTVAERIVLYCVNATTLRHENVTASAANRITSDTGADIAVGAGKTVELIYDPTSTRWRPIRF